MTDLNLGSFCPAHIDELVDQLVDYCVTTYGSREGAIRALAAVGVGAQQCTVRLPHAAHLNDGCPGLSLAEYVAGEGGTEPLRAQGDPDWNDPREIARYLHGDHAASLIGPDDDPDGPDYDETTETAGECRRDLLESEQ